MDRPRNISRREAMRWNVDVEHRRREYQPKHRFLSRKLKKAAQHVCFKGTTESDICLRTIPDGYPRTKWINRLIRNHLRITAQIRRKLECLRQQQEVNKLLQSPIDTQLINPAQHLKERYGGGLVLDINQFFVRNIPFYENETK